MHSQPLVIAHRGASGYLPEHTLEAKAYAYAAGADYLEQDLVLTRDGVPVVLHDVQVDTVTNVAEVFPERRREDGRYYAVDFTLAELRSLEARERISLKTGRPAYPQRYPVEPGPFRIHTFEDELRLVAGLNRSTGRNVGVYPELKQPAWHRQQGQEMAPIVLAQLAAAGYRQRTDRCFLQCFEADELRRIHADLGCELRLIQLIGDRDWRQEGVDPDLSTAEGLARAAQYADGVGPPLSRVLALDADGRPRIAALTRDAHALGLQVHPYTLRRDDLPKFAATYDEACRLLCETAGVDGVFTDFPDLMRQALAGASARVE